MDTNGWDEHKRAILHRLDAVEEDFSCQKRRCEGHLKSTQDQHDQLLTKIGELSIRLATLEGRLMGFFTAASVLGGFISLLVQFMIRTWK